MYVRSSRGVHQTHIYLIQAQALALYIHPAHLLITRLFSRRVNALVRALAQCRRVYSAPLKNSTTLIYTASKSRVHRRISIREISALSRAVSYYWREEELYIRMYVSIGGEPYRYIESRLFGRGLSARARACCV